MLGRPFMACILLIVSVCILTTCKKDNTAPVPGKTIIADNVSIIPDETWNNNLISMDSTNFTLTFSDAISSAMKIKPGDILVSGSGDGFLRKVTSVKTAGSDIQVATEFASLADAIEEGDFDIEKPLSPSQVKSIDYNLPGIKLRNANTNENPALNFTFDINTVVFDADRDRATTYDQIRLEGDFTFNLNLVAKVKISLFQGLKEIKFGVGASEKLNLNLVAGLSYQLPDNLDFVLATIRFTPIIVYIGGVPVVLNPVMKVHVGIEGNLSATITTGITQELSFSAGIHYLKSNGWSPYSDFHKSFEYYLPELYINANLIAYMKPEFEMKVYGVGGPYVNMKLYGRFAAQIMPEPSFKIYGGISLGAGARIKIFDKYVFDYSINDLFKAEILLFDKHRTQPVELPVVISSVGSVSSVSAIIGGRVTGDGGSLVTDRGVYWGASPDPVNTGSKLSMGSDTGTFSNVITELNPATTYYFKAYASNSKGPAYGAEMSFKTLAASVVSDVDGNIYNTVTIGSQVWLTENLKVTRLNDGQEIPMVTGSWIEVTTPAYTWYNNDKETSGAYYGALYNWYAINTNKLCPSGWHVSTDNDFKTLEIELGMSSESADQTGMRGTNEGSKIAGNGDLWSSGSLVSNESFGSSGINALPGGHLYYGGDFMNVGTSCIFFTATESNSSSAWYRQINNDGTQIDRSEFDKRDGFSVRCVKN
jgi:uncharacterized protein (TIGR02145 family)